MVSANLSSNSFIMIQYSITDVGVSEHAVHDIIAATTVIIVGVILSLLIFSVFYKHLRPAKSDSEAPKNSQQLVPHYSSQQSESRFCNCYSEITILIGLSNLQEKKINCRRLICQQLSIKYMP